LSTTTTRGRAGSCREKRRHLNRTVDPPGSEGEAAVHPAQDKHDQD